MTKIHVFTPNLVQYGDRDSWSLSPANVPVKEARVRQIILTLKDIERFWSRVDRSGGPNACWPWQGYKKPDGYGVVRFCGKNERAHRVAFMLTHGYWPEPFGLHECDNPPCCNPTHVHPGTVATNAQEMVERGRSAAGERHPDAKLAEDDVRKIRAAVSEGVSHRTLASQYGLDRGTIGRIARCEIWKQVT